MNSKNKIIEFYGNRSYRFDFFLSIGLVLILWLSKINFGFVNSLIAGTNDSTMNFLGIIVGFLLTTFSLLFLYDPQSSEKLKRLRGLPVYKSMLSSFVSTSFAIILISIGFIIINAFMIQPGAFFQMIILALIVFSFLRILKCIFYLYAIIELS